MNHWDAFIDIARTRGADYLARAATHTRSMEPEAARELHAPMVKYLNRGPEEIVRLARKEGYETIIDAADDAAEVVDCAMQNMIRSAGDLVGWAPDGWKVQFMAINPGACEDAQRLDGSVFEQPERPRLPLLYCRKRVCRCSFIAVSPFRAPPKKADASH